MPWLIPAGIGAALGFVVGFRSSDLLKVAAVSAAAAYVLARK